MVIENQMLPQDMIEFHIDFPTMVANQTSFPLELLEDEVGNPYQLGLLDKAQHMYDMGRMFSANFGQQLYPIIGMDCLPSLMNPMDNSYGLTADLAYNSQRLLKAGAQQLDIHHFDIHLPVAKRVDFAFLDIHVLVPLLFKLTFIEVF